MATVSLAMVIANLVTATATDIMAADRPLALALVAVAGNSKIESPFRQATERTFLRNILGPDNRQKNALSNGSRNLKETDALFLVSRFSRHNFIEGLNMNNNLMASVAVVALIATTGLAVAQGTPGAMKGGDAPAASAPPVASSPKAETSAPPNAPAPKGAEMAPAGPKAGATAQEKVDTKSMPKAAEEKSGAAPKAVVGSDTKASGEMNAGSKPSTAESAAPNSAKTPVAADSKSTTDSKTSGNAATSATVAPPAEKRTQIVSAIKQEKVEETTNINFNISIGTAVPSTVRFYPLPSRIVEIYPEWRGYDFILVRGRYVILRPRTHEIVYIIEG